MVRGEEREGRTRKTIIPRECNGIDGTKRVGDGRLKAARLT